MAIYHESLSSMVHFPVNHVKELELSDNCAKQKVNGWGRFLLYSDVNFAAVHTLKREQRWSVNSSSL